MSKPVTFNNDMSSSNQQSKAARKRIQVKNFEIAYRWKTQSGFYSKKTR